MGAAPILRIPQPRLTMAETFAPLRVLSLTGGGYRGLFTAQVLVGLCNAARVTGSVDTSIDVFAGTSIGGLMACALAVGEEPHRVLDAIDLHGPRVFKVKKLSTLRRTLFGTLYEKTNLEEAIDDCLKDKAGMKLKDIEQGLIIPAIDWVDGRVKIFMSGYFGQSHASDATLRQVCLATSAAPTYFDPSEVDGAPMLDGGLAANNPDVLAIMELLRLTPSRLPQIEMLSIGTAGADEVRSPEKAAKSGLKWAPNLATYMIDVQERTAAEQASRLLGDRYLRVNHTSGTGIAFQTMDVATDQTRSELMKAGSRAATDAYKSSGAFIDRMLSVHRRPSA